MLLEFKSFGQSDGTELTTIIARNGYILQKKAPQNFPSKNSPTCLSEKKTRKTAQRHH